MFRRKNLRFLRRTNLIKTRWQLYENLKISMKINSIQIITFLILTSSLSITAQVELKDFPNKPKTGDCYIKRPNDSKFVKISCELAKINKNRETKALQYKLKNLGYDVDIHGILDDKTIKAFELEKRDKKLRERLMKKRERKRLREERKLRMKK